MLLRKNSICESSLPGTLCSGAGHLIPCFVLRDGFLYTVIVPGEGFPHLSRVPGVCPGGGGVLDEIDSCIILKTRILNLHISFRAELKPPQFNSASWIKDFKISGEVLKQLTV